MRTAGSIRSRGGKMHEHAVRDAQAQEQQFRSYVQEAAGSQSPADQLAKLADLRDRGVITAEEFDREKAKDPGLSGTRLMPVQQPRPAWFGPVHRVFSPGALRVWVPRDRPGVPAPKPPMNWARLRRLAGGHRDHAQLAA